MARIKVRLSALLVVGAGTMAYALFATAQGQEAERQADGKAESQERQPMMQCPMMAGLKNIEMFPNSPALLLARAEELNLSDEQRQELEEIEQAARQKAHQVLDAEQQEKFKDAPDERQSMMELSQMQMKGMGGEGKMEGMCPMCMKMMGEKMMGGKMQKQKDSDQN